MLAYVRRSLADWRQQRRLRRIPRTPVAELVEGVEMRAVGIARPLGAVLEAPVSGRICVCYAVVVYDWHVDASVHVVRTEQGRAPFVLADGDARAVVDPARAEMSALFDHETRLDPRTPRAVELLDRLGVRDRNWSRTRALEISEAIIELDERIAVIGMAEREPDVDVAPSGYRDGDLPTRIRIFPTAISDDPRLTK